MSNDCNSILFGSATNLIRRNMVTIVYDPRHVCVRVVGALDTPMAAGLRRHRNNARTDNFYNIIYTYEYNYMRLGTYCTARRTTQDGWSKFSAQRTGTHPGDVAMSWLAFAQVHLQSSLYPPPPRPA